MIRFGCSDRVGRIPSIQFDCSDLSWRGARWRALADADVRGRKRGKTRYGQFVRPGARDVSDSHGLKTP
ncbi:hypothetical protein EVAR_10176_1 [Eumeta japonica]|uniref:Uncharacterized protein n=1 Tax=Eumeta variegata TaxID=151549 RepID=A0A4C1TE54_EUMVA|nr:hypothetical protein EVAR_10176_1 [Eumeta japonica]